MKAKIIPTLRYHDPDKALEWLRDMLDFEEHLIHRDENGIVVHAQLVWNGDMIMIGGMRDDKFGQHVVSPRDVGLRNTQSAYLVTDQVTQLHEKLLSHEVEIVLPLKTEDYGGQSFSCKDFEGNLWNVGSYDPWET